MFSNRQILKLTLAFLLIRFPTEGVYVTIGNPAFCLFLYLTGAHFRGELQHRGDVSEWKIKCRPIRTREIGGVSLSDILYVHDQERQNKNVNILRTNRVLTWNKKFMILNGKVRAHFESLHFNTAQTRNKY